MTDTEVYDALRALLHTDTSWHGPNDENNYGAGYWVSPGKFLAALKDAGLRVVAIEAAEVAS